MVVVPCRLCVSEINVSIMFKWVALALVQVPVFSFSKKTNIYGNRAFKSELHPNTKDKQ